MARRTARPPPTRDLELPALTRTCPGCGAALWAAYKTYRTVTTLDGLVRLGLQVRRCRGRDCPRLGMPLRPEGEGRWVLPQHEFGLDVIALVGALRHAEHRLRGAAVRRENHAAWCDQGRAQSATGVQVRLQIREALGSQALPLRRRGLFCQHGYHDVIGAALARIV